MMGKGLVYTTGQQPHEMTGDDERELADTLRGSLLILSTTSPDKRTIFRKLFTLLGIHDNPRLGIRQKAGVDLFFTDSGSVNIVPTKTSERTLDFHGNLDEKAVQQLGILKDADGDIRKQLVQTKEFDPETIKIMGMTEDSGVSLVFETPEGEPDREKKRLFIEKVTALISDRIRDRDKPWLVEHLATRELEDPSDSGFPGVNLHPLQNYLGGYPALLEVIYTAAEQAGVQNLRFKNTSVVSFANPATEKIYTKTFVSYGRLLTREEYQRKLEESNGEAVVNIDFTQIYDNQKNGTQKTMEGMRDNVLVSTSQRLPVDYPRREMVAWLQEIIGRRTLPLGRFADFDVGFVSPYTRNQEEQVRSFRTIMPGLRKVLVPGKDDLLSNPHAKFFDDADAVVLMPNGYQKKEGELQHDPNIELVLGAIVVAQTDPQSMCKPVILDNRSRKFSPVLKIVQDAFMQGRLLGDLPFFVAHTRGEMRRHLKEVQTMVRLAPRINKRESQRELPEVMQIPPDGVFTLFIGGGHENNTKQDLEEAFDLGYQCAKNGFRIVTGAGSVEGSMGATHTGYIQYHLDQIQNDKMAYAMDAIGREFNKRGNVQYDEESIREVVNEVQRQSQNADLISQISDLKAGGLVEELAKNLLNDPGILPGEQLSRKSWEIMQLKQTLEALPPDKFPQGPAGQYDAENIILEKPELLNDLADKGYIPRSLFYGFSMQDLLKIENPTGYPPPAITYSDAGNLSRRLQYLLAPGTKVFMPGSVGTDQELEYSIAQHLEGRSRKASGAANDSFFKDGTRDDDGIMIIYNRGGNLDAVLKHYGLMDENHQPGEESLAERAIREKYNVVVVDTAEDLHRAVLTRATNWLNPGEQIPAQRRA